MFQTIISRDKPQLQELGRKLMGTNYIAAALCLDHLFNTAPQISRTSSPLQVVAIMSSFFDYTQILQEISRWNPCTNSSFRKLLGIELVSDNVFLIPAQTCLYEQLAEYRIPVQGSSDDGADISRPELRILVERSLRDHLRNALSRVGSVRNWPLWAVPLFIR
jgi:hypothetical protein